jgi:hypothetical protein
MNVRRSSMNPEAAKAVIGAALRSRARYCDFRAMFYNRRSGLTRAGWSLWKSEAQNCWDLADAADAADAAALCRVLGIAGVHPDNASDEAGQDA